MPDYYLISETADIKPDAPIRGWSKCSKPETYDLLLPSIHASRSHNVLQTGDPGEAVTDLLTSCHDSTTWPSSRYCCSNQEPTVEDSQLMKRGETFERPEAHHNVEVVKQEGVPEVVLPKLPVYAKYRPPFWSQDVSQPELGKVAWGSKLPTQVDSRGSPSLAYGMVRMAREDVIEWESAKLSSRTEGSIQADIEITDPNVIDAARSLFFERKKQRAVYETAFPSWDYPSRALRMPTDYELFVAWASLPRSEKMTYISEVTGGWSAGTSQLPTNTLETERAVNVLYSSYPDAASWPSLEFLRLQQIQYPYPPLKVPRLHHLPLPSQRAL